VDKSKILTVTNSHAGMLHCLDLYEVTENAPRGTTIKRPQVRVLPGALEIKDLQVPPKSKNPMGSTYFDADPLHIFPQVGIAVIVY
jgi:hypothetical protein